MFWGGFISMIALIFSMLASIPLSNTMKPRNLPKSTSKAHLVRFNCIYIDIIRKMLLSSPPSVGMALSFQLASCQRKPSYFIQSASWTFNLQASNTLPLCSWTQRVWLDGSIILNLLWKKSSPCLLGSFGYGCTPYVTMKLIILSHHRVDNQIDLQQWKLSFGNFLLRSVNSTHFISYWDFLLALHWTTIQGSKPL